MAATVFISESNGPSTASEVVTDNISNLNFGGGLDRPNLIPGSNPVSIGAVSLAKWWRFKLAVLGGSSQVSNFRVWKSSGAYVTGEIIGGTWTSSVSNMYFPTYGKNVNAGATITVPISTDTGVALWGFTFATAPVPTALPASMVYAGGVKAGAIVGVGYSNYCLLMLTTTGATPAGSVNQKIFTVQYDES